MDRRTFLSGAASGSFIALSEMRLAAQQKQVEKDTRGEDHPLLARICLFTDLVDDFGYSHGEVARMLKQLEIAGPDLTVRQGGLIQPENAAAELPRMADVCREHGLTIAMLTTGITTAEDPTSQAILKTMSQLGIRFYKLGYYRYRDLANWQPELDAAIADVAKLAQVNERYQLEAGFHNHAGEMIGGAMWDLALLLDRVNSRSVGAYFDPAHATVEGSESGWQLGFHRLASRLKMLAIKDFVREKIDGRWRVKWCPLGEGMVRWPEFFRMLKNAAFNGPVSLHIEYDPGGRTKVERLDNSLQAAERDLEFLRQGIREAYS